jgi:simple sugar transport system permease protein
VSLGAAVEAFADGAWGSPYAVGASLNRAVALGLVGLGFIVAHRANLTNVGGEGQIAVGGIASTALCLYGGAPVLPGPLAWLVPLAAAALAGGLWGSIAGFLKVRIGTNEVISTLLLSFIAVWVLYGCVQSTQLLRQPMTNSATLPESLEVPAATQVPLLVPGLDMPLHLGAPVLLVLGAVVAVVLERALFGLRLRAVGLNPVAARRAGMPIGVTIVVAMFIAGAFAGLAGGFMLQGEQLALKARFPSGYGIDGLVVGLLARGTVKGVLASALLFGFLRSGGIAMELVAGVPSAIVLVIQGLVILLLAGSAWWLERGKAA